MDQNADALIDATAPAAARPRTPRGEAGWRRWLLPSLLDLLFIALIFWLFVAFETGWAGLLEDGDTGWHIRVGEWIMEHGETPRQDLFSFSKPGEPWYAWEWLSDVVLALLFQALGLKGVTLFGGVLIALFAAVMVRFMIWRGASLWSALIVGLLGVGASSVHFLSRPHLFTWLLLAGSLWLLEHDRRRPARLVWLLVPVMAVWANLHGGFLALLACLAVLAAGTLAGGLLSPGERMAQWRRTLRYSLLGIACAAATVINPYGVELHRHVFAYLRSGWITSVVEEFQAPAFRSENALQFEILLFLGLITVALTLSRRRLVEAGWILFWGHYALNSARHIPIFVIVAGPVIASELGRLWRDWTAGARASSLTGILGRLGEDLLPSFRRVTFWPLVAVAALVAVDEPLRWPKEFPDEGYPRQLVDRQADRLRNSRVFCPDEWADRLLYQFYPRQRVFLDGRTDFYGPEVGNQYIQLVGGRAAWRRLLDRHGVDVVLCPSDWPLRALLAGSPDWRLADAGEGARLFVRAETSEGPAQ